MTKLDLGRERIGYFEVLDVIDVLRKQQMRAFDKHLWSCGDWAQAQFFVPSQDSIAGSLRTAIALRCDAL